jgi:hypothetical protein
MEDFSKDIDIRGDYALFIESKHFTPNSDLKPEIKKRLKGCQPTFFRIIRNGKQQPSHGWIEDGEIVQWG